MSKNNSSIKEKIKKFGKTFVEKIAAAPEWIPLAIILPIIGVGIAAIFFSSKDANNGIPETQIVSKQTITQMYTYEGRTKGPLWVMQVVGPASIDESLLNVKFYEDDKLPTSMRSTFADYQDSGFDIAPLLDASDNGKFPLSTASPQLPQFSRGYWTKMDKYVKELLKKLDVDGIVVISGPLYLSKQEKNGEKYVTYRVIGENNVAVPTHFFKAIYYPVENDREMNYSMSSEIYVIPNENLDENTPLDTFRISLENFEKIAGIILPDDEATKTYLTRNGAPPR